MKSIKGTQFKIWANKLIKEYIVKSFNLNDELLKFRKKDILSDSGEISNKKTIEKAETEYDKFRVKQDQEYISSMDAMYKKYLEENKK